MTDFRWAPEKNVELRKRYGFGFERVLAALEAGALIEVRQHPNTGRYGHQKQLVVEIEKYAWVVPFVTDGQTYFFKTMFPSRKATRDYLGEGR